MGAGSSRFVRGSAGGRGGAGSSVVSGSVGMLSSKANMALFKKQVDEMTLDEV